MRSFQLNRRVALVGLGSVLAAPALLRPALANDSVSPFDFGLSTDTDSDQSSALQAAIDAASLQGADLRLPPGEYVAQNLRVPGNIRIIGSALGTHLHSPGADPVFRVGPGAGLVIDGIYFGGASEAGRIVLEESEQVTIRNCAFSGPGIGVGANASSATIDSCSFTDLGEAAIHSTNSRGGMIVRGNRVSQCGNAGIRIWRDEPGHDGSIVTGNIVGQIDWRGGGNGQNGNGVNVFRADGVIVSDNVFTDCAFTAIRVNAGRNTQIRGNTCISSGEVAIFSEFEFSGSVIADNIVDGAATGIDITNLDTGGHLATCTGNIVRNIFPRSEVNPDTRPVGIYAEADTIVANNVIENVPGVGIVAGYGPFVRNVSISGNVLTGCIIGIGVTVVDDSAVGPVRISGNLIAAPSQHGIVGFEWETIASDDLAGDATRYRHLTVTDNTIS